MTTDQPIIFRFTDKARTWALLAIFGFFAPFACGQQADCGEAYGGKSATCVHVACNAKYQSFLGVWKGPFHNYVKELSKNDKSVFRPYENTTTYQASDCLKDADSGETFIIGHMTNSYPAFSSLPARTDHVLLITGTRSDGTEFLRIVDGKNEQTYRLEYKNKAASLALWTMTLPAHDKAPEMEYTTIDGRDFNAGESNRRNVAVTLRVGPKEHPYFDDLIGYGYHILQP